MFAASKVIAAGAEFSKCVADYSLYVAAMAMQLQRLELFLTALPLK